MTADLPPTGLLLWLPVRSSATPRLVAVSADRRDAVVVPADQVARNALGERRLRVVKP